MESERKANRLSKEKSPYLLEHAYNPVDWYPWGEEAFEAAKSEDKPIFLSIGYSSCHWCHVMRNESFEDESVALILNKWFICIKVDREERPDIDHVYMSFSQAMTGKGGWPLSIFMTWDQKPFYAATYIPKENNYGLLGFIALASTIHEIWEKERERILSSSDDTVRVLEESIMASSKEELEKRVLTDCYEDLVVQYDAEYGGFGKSPKFPTPHSLLFLLRWWKETKNPSILEIVERTLQGMYSGGIFDHIGYGFSRYSVDEKWLVPHFEKMLYDNALLAKVYTEAFQATGRHLYKEVAEKVIDYVLRALKSPEGGFYSSEDADSEGEEGKFYSWSREEILTILGEKDGHWFAAVYGVTEEGNFEGKNILNLIGNDYEELMTEAMRKRLSEARKKMFEVREKRVHPHQDDKILTSWNGLMIGTLAYAGRTFRNEKYLMAAKDAAKFVLSKVVDSEGRLLAYYRDGEAKLPGYLDSYSFFISGLLELHQATMEDEYLKLAIQYTEEMLRLFLDEKTGDFYLNSKESEKLVVEAKDLFDSAIPSGNSVAAMNLMVLYSITENMKYHEYAKKLFESHGKSVREQPSGFTYLLSAFIPYVNGTRSLVIAGDRTGEETQKMLELLFGAYLPMMTVLVQDNDEEKEKGRLFAPGKGPIDGRTTAYICRNFTCEQGITSLEEFQEKLLNKG